MYQTQQEEAEAFCTQLRAAVQVIEIQLIPLQKNPYKNLPETEKLN